MVAIRSPIPALHIAQPVQDWIDQHQSTKQAVREIIFQQRRGLYRTMQANRIHATPFPAPRHGEAHPSPCPRSSGQGPKCRQRGQHPHHNPRARQWLRYFAGGSAAFLFGRIGRIDQHSGGSPQLIGAAGCGVSFHVKPPPGRPARPAGPGAARSIGGDIKS